MITHGEKQYYISIKTLILGYILIILGLSLFCTISFTFVNIFLKSRDIKFSYFMPLFLFLFILTALLLIETISKSYRFSRIYFAKIPALILTQDKLIDNLNNQIYNWNDIEKISIATIPFERRVNFISISLIDPYKFINKINNPFKRLNSKINQRYFKGAFSIQPNLIKCENNKLFEDLTEYFNREKI
ncbi:MAG: STM3941 family protein [Leadbetterella sp.]|nr:STM3941 family protein [Leadbetterella sp.]